MTKEQSDDGERGDSLLSRRELLGTSAALGTGALLAGGPATSQARADMSASGSMQTSSEPRIKLGDDYAIDDSPNGAGDLVVEHLPSGATFSYDSSAGEWSLGSLNATSVSSGEVNGIQYASNNHSEVPDFSTAIADATDGDTVVLIPGRHDISTEVTVNTNLTLVMYGTLVKQADIVALRFNSYCHLVCPDASPSKQTVDSAVADTTDGIVFHRTPRTTGMILVEDVGGHGVFFHQAATGDSCNDTVATVRVIGAGGDGVRIENTTANAPNVNNMFLTVNKAYNCGGDGYHRVSGFGNAAFVSVEANSGAGIRVNSDRNDIQVVHAEGNTGKAVVITTNADFNYIHGDIGNSYTNNAPGTNVVEFRPHIRTFRTSTSAVDQELVIDEANGRLVWTDSSGQSYYVSGTAI